MKKVQSSVRREKHNYSSSLNKEAEKLFLLVISDVFVLLYRRKIEEFDGFLHLNSNTLTTLTIYMCLLSHRIMYLHQMTAYVEREASIVGLKINTTKSKISSDNRK